MPAIASDHTERLDNGHRKMYTRTAAILIATTVTLSACTHWEPTPGEQHTMSYERQDASCQGVRTTGRYYGTNDAMNIMSGWDEETRYENCMKAAGWTLKPGAPR